MRWRYLALDAAQVDQAEVAGQGGPERGEGLQQRDASPLGQHGQRQHLVVQEGAGHVTDHRREAVGGAVGHLREGRVSVGSHGVAVLARSRAPIKASTNQTLKEPLKIVQHLTFIKEFDFCSFNLWVSFSHHLFNV